MNGWIKLNRALIDHPLVGIARPKHMCAWIWMIMEAQIKPRDVRVRGKIITLERGQFTHSIRHIAAQVGMSKTECERFLTDLKEAKMVETVSGTAQMVISICNYNEYQGDQDNLGTKFGTKLGQSWDNKEEGKKERMDISLSKGGFDAWWQASPFTGSPDAAMAAYADALDDASPAELLAGVTRYREECRDRPSHFIARPTNWLAQRRWKDYEAAPQKPKLAPDEVMAVKVQHAVDCIKDGRSVMPHCRQDEALFHRLIEMGHTAQSLFDAGFDRPREQR